MSLRIDTSEWIAGSLVIGDVGGGVLGSDIPSAGESGPPYTYNDLSLPADANKEICGRITTWPSAGTLFAHEDTSFEFTGAPNGTYTFQYQLYVDYVPVGSPTTVTLTVGGTAHVATGSLLSGASVITGAAAKSGVAIHVATGAFSASSATISGTAEKRATHTSTGAIAAGSASIAGIAARKVAHDASGSIVAGFASVHGTSSRSIQGTIVLSQVDIDAIAAAVWAYATRAMTTDGNAAVADQVLGRTWP